ncbi:MAG TPA: hypothetical protein VF290_22150 [Pyrinomonadaceae bacterium]
MAQPSVSEVHVNRPLTNASTAYVQTDDKFVATQVFPTVPVEKQSDLITTYNKNDFFRDEAQPRADGDQSAGSGYGTSNTPYACIVYALHKDIGPQVRRNADPERDLDREATLWLTQRMLIRQEKQWVDDGFKTGVWANDVTPASLWSDFTSSDIIEDMETGKETILINTGQEANKAVFGYKVFRKAKNHPDILDRIKYTTQTTGRTVTPQLLAAMFDLDQVLVAKSVIATNREGETAVYDFTHGKHALLLHTPDAPGLLTPAAGYTLSWREISQGMGADIAITRERIPLTNGADRVEAQVAFDNKILGTDLGYFFNGAVA